MTMKQLATSPDDILSAIFALAQLDAKKERFAFRAYDSTLQNIFGDLRSKYDWLPFVFSDSGPEPYSPEITDAVAKLQLAGLLGRENPDFEIIFLRPAAAEYFSEVLVKRIDEETLAKLKQVAHDFVERVALTG